MASGSDADERIDTPHDLADHVVATSEPEDPEETMRRLFGEHDTEELVRAQEAIARLFGEDENQEASSVRESMAEVFGGQDRPESAAEPPAEGGLTGAAADVLRPDEATRHEVHVGDRVEYGHCVDGVLFAAELVDHEPVTVRSFDPVSGEPVTFEVTDDGREVTPGDAVVGMGMAEAAADSEDMVGFGVGMAEGRNDPGTYVDDPLDMFCRHFNAFERRETYEQWAEDADAVSVAVPADVFAELIRRLVSDPAFG